MSTKISTPGPSEEERALQAEQVQLLRQQSAMFQQAMQQQQAIMPALFREAGFEPVFDESGMLIDLQRPDDPLRDRENTIKELFLERTEAALRGELPVDPQLERELGSQEETLRERLLRQFGAGFETTTPGIETLSRFQEQAEGLRAGARRAELTLAEQLGLARQNAADFRGMNQIGLATQGAVGLPGQVGAMFGQAAQGFQMPLGNLFNNRQLMMKGNMAASQARSQMISGIAGGVGQLGGLALGGIFG